MKALVMRSGALEVADVPLPRRDGECRIRVRLAGICGTDLQMLAGYANFDGVPGHEFVGIVDDAPAEHRRWIGRRVVGEINVGCGSCRWCARGVREHCVARTVVGIRGRDGAFADALCLPAANLHEVPPGLPDEAAVFVEPVAAACRILEQVPAIATSRVAVLGDGRLGLLVGQVLQASGAEVVLLGRHEDKLDVARRVGLAARRDEAGSEPAASFEAVVDATGSPSGLRRAAELVEPRGTIVMKSTFHGEAALASWPIVVNEATIVGSRCGPFHTALGMLAAGRVQVQPLVSRVAALDDFASAFADARRRLKVLLRPAGDGAQPL